MGGLNFSLLRIVLLIELYWHTFGFKPMPPLIALRLALAWTYAAAVSLIGVGLCLMRPFNPGNNPTIARLFAWGGRRRRTRLH